MELIFDIIGELVLGLLGKVTRHSKKTSTQTIVDILVAAAGILAAGGFTVWKTVSCCRRGNIWAAAIYASAAVIVLLLISFVVLRRIIRRRKSEKAS